ncbi:hypothetical protein HN011_003157 [Eciton burchellii]|nr:hypothetical protein HN011_003157 [Eciton burchellii]
MAVTIRGLTRLNVSLASNIISKNNFLNFYRCLYSEKVLGLPGYENTRLNFHNQFLNVENTFRTKMQESCNQESSMIFTEDLKSMLHLAQKKPEDIELLVKMLTKYNNQDQEMRFGTFVFGPVVMRTFYYLDEPDIALTAFKDPQFESFFKQLISYQILLSLLYKHGKYTEMREAYDIIRNKFADGKIGHPKNSLLLVMAGCYQENTPEAFKYALDMYKEMLQKDFKWTRKTLTFLAALAIKQNVPHIAVEIISTIRMSRYIDVRCLTIMAYADLKKFDEIVSILRMSLDDQTVKDIYFYDVIEKLEQTMMNENVPENFEGYKLIASLKSNNRIISKPLESHLCATIDVDPSTMRQRLNQNYNFSQQQRQQRFQPFMTN